MTGLRHRSSQALTTSCLLRFASHSALLGMTRRGVANARFNPAGYLRRWCRGGEHQSFMKVEKTQLEVSPLFKQLLRLTGPCLQP